MQITLGQYIFDIDQNKHVDICFVEIFAESKVQRFKNLIFILYLYNIAQKDDGR